MDRIRKRFKTECDKTPHFSSLVNYGHTIEYQRYSRHVIAQGLISLVDSDDYSKSDLEEIIEHLLRLSHSERPVKYGSI